MIKEYERELNELQEGKLISKEDLHEGDEIISPTNKNNKKNNN